MSPVTVPKIFMAGGISGFAYYLVMRQYWFPNPYKTRAVQDSENNISANTSTTSAQSGSAAGTESR